MDKFKTPLSNILEAGTFGADTNNKISIQEIVYESVVQVIAYKSTLEELQNIIQKHYEVLLPEVGQFIKYSGGYIQWVGPYRYQIVSNDVSVLETIESLIPIDIASVVDLSHSRAIFRLEGKYAPHLLAKGASIDFHHKDFCDGRTILTNISHIGVMVNCIENQEQNSVIDLYVYRTFAKSFYHFITESAKEWGYETHKIL